MENKSLQNKQTETKGGNAIALRNEQGLQAFAQSYVKGNQIVIPQNYDVAGAASGLYLQLLDLKDKDKKPALEVVSEHSLKKAVMDMVTMGLDPRKKQCYPIVYGNTLNLQVGYFGNQRRAKTFNIDLGDFRAQVIFVGDTYETQIEKDGRKTLVKHTQPFGGKRDLESIVGAYSIVQTGLDKSGEPIYDLEDMTVEQIKSAWSQSSNASLATHKKFSEEMAKKTVISRHAKRFINTSDDSAVIAEQAAVKAEKAITLDINKEIMEESSEFNVPPAQHFEENDTPTADDINEANNEMFNIGDFDEDGIKIEQDNESDIMTVRYAEWKENYSKSGEWEQVKNSYNATDRTVEIRRKN